MAFLRILYAVSLGTVLTAAGCTASSSPEQPAAADSNVVMTDAATEDSVPLQEFTTTLIAEGLDTPAGLAVQAGSGDAFVSTAQGIIRLDAADEYSAHPEITGFDEDAYGKGPSYRFGPLGLCFLNDTTLVVGGGGLLDGEDVVQFFEVGAVPLAEPVSAGSARYRVGPIPQGEYSHRGEGNYFALQVHNGAIYVTSHGDDTKGWISKVTFDGPTPVTLQPVIAAKTATGVDGPSGLAVLPNNKLLVSQTGELHERPDSLLSVFDPVSGELEQKMETGLYDITAILIHPTTGTIYALDFAWAVPEEGGLYSLEVNDDRGQIVATKHASLLHPTAMAVTTDGDLIVTCVEDQDEQTDARGKVYRVALR